MSDSYLDEYWQCSEIRPDGSFLSGVRRLGWGKHIFGPTTGLLETPPAAQLTQVLELTDDQLKCIGVRPWVISVQAIDLFRFAPGPGPAPAPFRPVGDQDVFDRGSRYSVLQAEIEWNDGTYPNRKLRVDIAGGITLHAYAQNVTVRALIPEDAIAVDSNTDIELPPFSNSAFDSVVSTRIAPSNKEAMEGTVGYNFTRQIANDGSLEVVPIPAGAREVSIYQAGGPPTTSYEFGGFVAGAPIGVITPDANGNALNQPIPNAPYMRIPPGAAPRTYAFIFRVFP